MNQIELFSQFGEFLTVDIDSKCKDGRKIPIGINRDTFMQLNVYQWLDSIDYSETIFTYNPFPIHPIRTRSIVEVIDPLTEKFPEQKHRKNSKYYLPRIFDNAGMDLDPISINENGLVVLCNSIPEEDVFFQTNIPVDNNKVGLLKTNSRLLKKFYQILGHQIYSGTLEQHSKQ